MFERSFVPRSEFDSPVKPSVLGVAMGGRNASKRGGFRGSFPIRRRRVEASGNCGEFTGVIWGL